MQIKNQKSKIKIILGLVLFLIFWHDAQAQSLSLTAPKTTYRVGESFQISLTLNTGGKSINTVSGKISLPSSQLQILDLRYGNSIVSLWVERPKADAAGGTITFTGGVPGGFAGSSGPILSFGAKVKETGSAVVTPSEIKILLNDGQGTELSGLKLNSLRLTLNPALPPAPSKVEGPPPEEVYTPLPDTVAPENFTPFVSRHPSVEDNKYFVSFFAVDKDSGISYYEVKEIPHFLPLGETDWVRTESPYVLKGQYWVYEILVRACDQAGNCTQSFALKPLHPTIMWTLLALGFIAALFLGRFSSRFSSPRPRRRRVV